ncbi:MAG: M48 family metallopeptidase [Candidatus Scalindua sp.]|nr:M48 family metallopeptidase [Candidatus Scalindua sp.]
MSNNEKDKALHLSKKYSAQKNISLLSGACVTILYLVFMALLGSNILKYYLWFITTNQYLLIALYLFAFILLLELFTMPLQLYSGFILEHLFKLSNQTFLGWIRDELKKFLLSVVFLIFLGEIMYLFLRNFPGSWWILTSIVWIFFSIIMAKLAPVLILPLFYKMVPIERVDIKEGFLKLAEGTGITIEGVYKINLSKNTKKANAALAGLGSTRRVLLGDTLLESYSSAEINSVFAHELGHHVYHHIWKLLAIGVITSFAGFALCHYVVINVLTYFGFQYIHDIAAFPLLCIVFAFFGLLLLPIQNACSRRWERACDKYAIIKTNNPQAFISTMNKLADQNLADRAPNRIIELLFYDHPPIAKRIEVAKNFL